MRRGIELGMNKGRVRFIAVLTAVVVLVLTVFCSHTVITVDRKVTRSCFDELKDATRKLANDLRASVGSDSTALCAIGAVIGTQDGLSDEQLCLIMNSYGFDTSYISYLEILRPDGTMLDEDGCVRDVSAWLDFAAEAQKGAYISDICDSTHDPDIKVIRNAVPITKDGKTIYMLYGAIRLTELAERYTTSLYNGHAYVYIVDGDTGDFILDTWHKTLGNIIEMGSRKMLPGYSLERSIQEMQNGVGGDAAFVSKTTGSVLFMRHEPVNINNWNVMVTVEQQYALEKSESISRSLYIMTGVIGVVLLLYIACVTVILLSAYRQVQRLGTEDQSTEMQNRNMYEKFLSQIQNKLFAQATCVYVDVNGLHEINNVQGHAAGDRLLQLVANALKQEFEYASLYRIGGDEFVALSTTDGLELCRAKMLRATSLIEKSGYSVSCGIFSCENETGLNRIVREADEEMLRNKGEYYARKGCGRKG